MSVSLAGVLAAIVVVLLTAVYTAIHPEPLVDGLTRLVPPPGRRVASHVLRRLGEAYLGWLRGLVVGMLLLGILTYLALELAGIGYAAFFAILTAVPILATIKILVEELWINPHESSRARLAVVRAAAPPARPPAAARISPRGRLRARR